MRSDPVDAVDLVDIVDTHPCRERFLVLEVPDVSAVVALAVGSPASTAKCRLNRYEYNAMPRVLQGFVQRRPSTEGRR